MTSSNRKTQNRQYEAEESGSDADYSSDDSSADPNFELQAMFERTMRKYSTESNDEMESESGSESEYSVAGDTVVEKEIVTKRVTRSTANDEAIASTSFAVPVKRTTRLQTVMRKNKAKANDTQCTATEIEIEQEEVLIVESSAGLFLLHLHFALLNSI